MALPVPGKAPLPESGRPLLGYAYIDTGAMYRAVTCAFGKRGTLQ